MNTASDAITNGVQSTEIALVTTNAPILDEKGADRFTPDQRAAFEWLSVPRNKSPHTYRAYLYEIKRWLAFLEYLMGYDPRLLPKATEQHVLAYKVAMGRENREPGSPDFVPTLIPTHTLERWQLKAQPFKEELSLRSISRAINVLSGIYTFLSKHRLKFRV